MTSIPTLESARLDVQRAEHAFRHPKPGIAEEARDQLANLLSQARTNLRLVERVEKGEPIRGEIWPITIPSELVDGPLPGDAPAATSGEVDAPACRECGSIAVAKRGVLRCLNCGAKRLDDWSHPRATLASGGSSPDGGLILAEGPSFDLRPFARAADSHEQAELLALALRQMVALAGRSGMTMDRLREQLVRAAEGWEGLAAKAREALVHRSVAPFTAACGADEPNQRTTQVAANVTCSRCGEETDVRRRIMIRCGCCEAPWTDRHQCATPCTRHPDHAGRDPGPAPGPGEAPPAPDACPACGTSQGGWSSCGNLDCPSTRAAVAPDGLRGRVCAVVAEGYGCGSLLVFNTARDAPSGETARMVAAVERALLAEREAGVQQGRRDAEGAVLDDDTIRQLAASQFGNEHPIPTTLGTIRALLDEASAAEAGPSLDEATRMEIAHALTLAMHLYAGHKIDSRGPTGCIYEALRRAAPAVAADLGETLSYSATYARFWEDGKVRPGKRSGAEVVPSPRDEAALDACTCYRGCDDADGWHQHADDLCPIASHAGRMVIPVEARERAAGLPVIAALRARADRLIEAGGGSGAGAEREREINERASEVIRDICDEMGEGAPVPSVALATVDATEIDKAIDSVRNAAELLDEHGNNHALDSVDRLLSRLVAAIGALRDAGEMPPAGPGGGGETPLKTDPTPTEVPAAVPAIEPDRKSVQATYGKDDALAYVPPVPVSPVTNCPVHPVTAMVAEARHRAHGYPVPGSPPSDWCNASLFGALAGEMERLQARLAEVEREREAAHRALDAHGIPRGEASGLVYSLGWRVGAIVECAEKAEAAGDDLAERHAGLRGDRLFLRAEVKRLKDGALIDEGRAALAAVPAAPPAMPARLQVGIALISRPRTPDVMEYLIQRRPEDASFGAGLWEFPGGKQEERDHGSFACTVVREAWEELAVGGTVEGDRVAAFDLDPPTLPFPIYVEAYHLAIEGEPRPIVASAIEWHTLDEIAGMQVTPATARIVDELRRV